MKKKTMEFWSVKFKIKQKRKVRKLLDEDFANSINWIAKKNGVQVIFNEDGDEYFCFSTEEDQKKFISELQNLCTIRNTPLQFFGSNEKVPFVMEYEEK